MTRPILVILVVLGLSPALFAGPATCSMPDAASLNKDCYAQIGPALQAAGGLLTQDVRNAYLGWAEKTILEELRQGNRAIPAPCLADVRRDGALRDAIFGSVYPPDPSILQNYAQLRADLGESFLAKYRSLAVAISIAKRLKGVENAQQTQEIGRDYQAGFWADESLQHPSSDGERTFISRIADFMTQTKDSAADVYQNGDMQQQLKAYLAKNGISGGYIGEVRKSVQFGERLKDAMVVAGQRPGAREPKPSTVTWMRHLVEIETSTPTSTPTADGKPMPWPLFPIDAAPWPLLMPLAHSIPLSEANYIWEAFQGEHGSDRYHTYGPYRGDDDVMPDSLKPSRWFWDAWPDRIVHGGECVPISKGTVDLYSALDKPAMWAGQPGHANLISFQYVGGSWTAEIEQAFAGGPDVTCAQWYFDEDPGTQIRYRDLYYWPGAEYQLGVALGMNIGLDSYMDTRIAANIFRVLPSEERPTLGVKLLRSVLAANPYNPEIWYRLAVETPDAVHSVTLSEAAIYRKPGLVSDRSGNASPELHGGGGAADQYWRTVAQFVTQYGVLSHSTPQKFEEMRRAYTILKAAPGVSGDDLAAYADKFVADNPTDPVADNAGYDQKLADGGDAYAQLRMGQRYRDGDGVPTSYTKSIEYLARSMSHGDPAAAAIMGRLYPVIPRDMIVVSASSIYNQAQQASHLVDGTGMSGAVHDNNDGAVTMWQSGTRPAPKSPAAGLAPSPAWVRFDFARPMRFDSILIWNHNQLNLTDRGLRRTRIFGTTDGVTWIPLLAAGGVELPRASGAPLELPVTLTNAASAQPIKAVIIAADAVGGNWGGDCYGLSAVQFVIPKPMNVVPAKAITVTASSVYTPTQGERHLVDGSGMLGIFHDNAHGADTMWHTTERPASQPPAPGLPASPAWVRFDFAQPEPLDAILIWNHNQPTMTDRGFRKLHIYGTTDGANWRPLMSSDSTELPQAGGTPWAEPTPITLGATSGPIKSVIIAADAVNGNYGSDTFGLSAVRFVVKH